MVLGVGVPRHQGDRVHREVHATTSCPGPNFHWEGQLSEAGASMFYSLYFAMTGLHALHMIIGLGIMTVTRDHGVAAARSTPTTTRRSKSPGLYWHFVDIVWIFLFPLLYLIGRHYHRRVTKRSCLQATSLRRACTTWSSSR